MTWQPIRSAPKNGYFDVWAKQWLVTLDKFHYQRFTDCDIAPCGGIRTWTGTSAKHLFELGFHPVYWMPLPEPPEL